MGRSRKEGPAAGFSETSASTSGLDLLESLERIFLEGPIQEIGLVPDISSLPSSGRSHPWHPHFFWLEGPRLAIALPATRPLHAAASSLLHSTTAPTAITTATTATTPTTSPPSPPPLSSPTTSANPATTTATPPPPLPLATTTTSHHTPPPPSPPATTSSPPHTAAPLLPSSTTATTPKTATPPLPPATSLHPSLSSPPAPTLHPTPPTPEPETLPTTDSNISSPVRETLPPRPPTQDARQPPPPAAPHPPPAAPLTPPIGGLAASRALVLLCPDNNTAWNFRKRWLRALGATEEAVAAHQADLHLARLALALWPKSAGAWEHRRWVIGNLSRMGAGEALEWSLELALLESVCERSFMNYRAWSHRRWLLNYMPEETLAAEVAWSARWVKQHPADSCGFSYRQAVTLAQQPSVKAALLQEDLALTRDLLKTYSGREAVWLHRRAIVQELAKTQPDGWVHGELAFSMQCVEDSLLDEIDGLNQRYHAVAHKLWCFSLASQQQSGVKVESQRVEMTTAQRVAALEDLEVLRPWLGNFWKYLRDIATW